jgi:hypothetical protein
VTEPWGDEGSGAENEWGEESPESDLEEDDPLEVAELDDLEEDLSDDESDDDEP